MWITDLTVTRQENYQKREQKGSCELYLQGCVGYFEQRQNKKKRGGKRKTEREKKRGGLFSVFCFLFLFFEFKEKQRKRREGRRKKQGFLERETKASERALTLSLQIHGIFTPSIPTPFIFFFPFPNLWFLALIYLEISFESPSKSQNLKKS